jgi:WD40 repeat protein
MNLLLLLVLLQPPDAKATGQEDAQRLLQKEREEKNRLLVLVDVLRAEQAWERDDIVRVRELMDKHIPAKGAADYRGPEWHKFHALTRYQLRELPGAIETGWYWSPDGRFIVPNSGLHRNQPTITDVRTGEQVNLVEQVSIDLPNLKGALGESGLSVSNWSPDGRWFAVTSRDSTVVWDATTKKVTKLLTRPAVKEFTIYHHAWSPDGKSIALPVGDGTVRVVETATGKETRKLTAAGGAHTARWSDDGKWIAVAGPAGIAVFAADTGKELFSHKLKVALPITGVMEWSPKASWLAVSTPQGLLVYEGATGKKQWTFRAINTSGGILPNERQLVWLPDNEHLLAWVVGPSGRPLTVPHGQLLALWDLNTGKAIHDWMNQDGSPFKKKEAFGTPALYWSSSGRLLQWSDHLQSVGFTTWSVSPPKQLGSGVVTKEQNPGRQVRVFAASPDGKRVAAVLPPDFNDARSGRSFDELIVFDAETGKEVFRSRAFPVTSSGQDGTNSITWSPDSTRIFLAGGHPPRSKLKVFDATADRTKAEKGSDKRP